MDVPSVAVTALPDPLPADLHVIDVREPAEWRAGHVEGALHVPLEELPDRADELPATGRLLVVCRIGGRSARATAWLADRGTEAVNLDGGLFEWEAAGRPLVSETGDPARVV